jgi:hypothetical protein
MRHGSSVSRGATSAVVEMSSVGALATPARCPRTTCARRVEGPERAVRSRRTGAEGGSAGDLMKPSQRIAVKAPSTVIVAPFR